MSNEARGTYPAPNAPPIPPAAPVPSRRVGTFTMALCLIATGLVLLLHIFWPGIPLVTIARFAPVVLVLLGTELLVACLRHKQEKLRMDGLSIFLSLVLIFGSLAVAAASEHDRHGAWRQNASQHQRQWSEADNTPPAQEYEARHSG